MIGFLSPGGPVALFVFGFLLAKKCTNANTGVGVVQVFDKLIALTRQLRVQAAAISVTEQLFDAGQRVRRSGVELFAQFQGLLQGQTCIREAIDHTQLLQALGADALTAHQQLGGQLARVASLR